jgi:hypothetical protein
MDGDGDDEEDDMYPRTLDLLASRRKSSIGMMSEDVGHSFIYIPFNMWLKINCIDERIRFFFQRKSSLNPLSKISHGHNDPPPQLSHIHRVLLHIHKTRCFGIYPPFPYM